jgi:LmbE family N-acetylglucosaminyl deacetylase
MNQHVKPLTPKVVLGVAAHPDDLDFYAGGAMAAFAKQGAAVYYLVLTDGGKGTGDRSMQPETLRDLRRDEQHKAAKILGVKDVSFRDYPDGALENSLAVKREIVKVIRQVQPDVVVTFDPTVSYVVQDGLLNHPDHSAAGPATLDAVYPLARDHLSFPDLLAEGYEPHATSTVLLINLGQPSTFAVDITDTLNAKFEALGEHASQFTLQKMKDAVRQQAAKAGKPHGYTYAEPFVRIDIA